MVIPVITRRVHIYVGGCDKNGDMVIGVIVADKFKVLDVYDVITWCSSETV